MRIIFFSQTPRPDVVIGAEADAARRDPIRNERISALIEEFRSHAPYPFYGVVDGLHRLSLVSAAVRILVEVDTFDYAPMHDGNLRTHYRFKAESQRADLEGRATELSEARRQILWILDRATGAA